jgi:hypothetical protein
MKITLRTLHGDRDRRVSVELDPNTGRPEVYVREYNRGSLALIAVYPSIAEAEAAAKDWSRAV